MKSYSTTHQQGFTILELMIATMVFSVILLVVAAGILSFTKQYIKGITSSNTQSVSRAIMSDVVQNIQFSGGQVTTSTVTDPVYGTSETRICAGNVAYYFVRGQQFTATQHGLIKDTNGCGATGINFVSPSSSQHEMLNHNMRVAELSVAQPASDSTSASVTVSIISGSYDTFTDNNGTLLASEATAPTAAFTWSKAVCRGGAGSQFCDVSRLTTFVQGRIGN